jgi:hypothetical protein
MCLSGFSGLSERQVREKSHHRMSSDVYDVFQTRDDLREEFFVHTSTNEGVAFHANDDFL